MPGGQCLTQKSSPSHIAARKIFLPSRGVRKIFKIKGQRLAKNAFPEI